VIFDHLFRTQKSAQPATHALQVGSRAVPLLMVRHPRARRYLLRLRPDGVAKVTIPRRGNIKEARDFAARSIGWLEQQFQSLAAQPKTPVMWGPGTEILFRGEMVRIEVEDGKIRFGSEQTTVPDSTTDFRPAIQKHLRELAQQELPYRVHELARSHGVAVCRASVRNQKTRWGSCSRKGTISLNWRLIQTPGFVRDYVILHELAHRRHMNHSDRFWQEVKRLCPDYLEAERWVKQNSSLLK
jgi:predicted metal-dependent hydrolase